ncbi:hypothetical protein NSZ01_31020 [Nocardioides szechwanensis]|uniref:Camelysin metallo-endopeptidase n=1 Tax=Nocardioides szechwanensis TaxID=1005944 RepID=A0A1H0JW29_9ACTN|nr:hypothetical protein [Nocardioides szechwanensis]GEP35334.1 hypothetical protein NSZ01_31020 [Nocardioides szechwanensis]SDO47916.1 hypothetical protein SAMN05192576_4082 [Nocardioides szechwanensis]
MRTPSTTAAKIAVTAATPVAMIAAAALIWQSSYAAFSGTTRNSGNDWSTGSIALTDDDAGSARFQVTNMLPGQTQTKCITVTATTTAPGTVKAYALNAVASTSGLESAIKVTVNTGDGGSFADCTGFVAHTTGNPIINNTSLANLALASSYANGVGGWPVIAGTQSRTYQITWTFDTTGLTQTQVDNFQGTHTGLDLQWELQSS